MKIVLVSILTALVILFFSVVIGMAFAEAPLHIDIYEHPFTATVLENGSITIHNEDDSRYDFVAWGWFDQVLLAPNDSITIQLPTQNCGNTCFIPGEYYFTDLSTGEQSILTIEAIYIPPPPPPIMVTPPPMNNTDVFVSVSSGNTQTTQVEYESHFEIPTIEDPYNNLFNGVEYSNDDLKNELFQASQHMVELSTNLSNALEEVAQLKSQIQNMNGTSSSEVLQMKAEIQTLKEDRDYWKDLAETWYAVAINQMRIMVDVLGL